MKAIILAAGYGTRLKDVGERLPKGLIPFDQTNLITETVREIRTLGITEIAVVTNNKYYNQFENWNSKLTEKTILINDGSNTPDTRLGALGDLKLAIQKLKWTKDNILMSPSDTYFAFKLRVFLETINMNPDEPATIVRKMEIEDIRNRLGCAVLSDKNKIIDFVEKPDNPPSLFAAIPFYYYPAPIHALLKEYESEGNSMDAPGNIVPWWIKRKISVNACIVKAETIDVGTIKELEILKGRVSS